MAVTPTSKNQSWTSMEATGNNVVAGVRHAKIMVRVGSATLPISTDDNQAYIDGSFLLRGTAFTIAWSLATRKVGGVGADIGNIGAGLWVFEDNADGAGIGTGNIQYIDLSPQAAQNFANSANYAVIASGTANVTLAKSGTYKFVAVMYSLSGLVVNAATPPLTSRVRGTVAIETDFYVDSDNNSAFSAGAGDDPAIKVWGVGRTAWVRVATDVQTLSGGINPLRYTNSPLLTLDASAGTFAGTTTKEMRVGYTTSGSPATTAPAKNNALVMPLNGASATTPAGSNNIDTDFPLVPTNFRRRVFVGPSGGQANTPANEKPNLLAAGTLTLVDVNDQAWTVFTATGMAGFLAVLSSYAVEHTSDLSIGSGITATSSSFSDAGRLTAQNLFRRTGPTITANAIPFLRSILRDADGTLLPNTSVITSIRTQNAAPVVDELFGAAVTALGTAILDQSYTIAAIDAAFNRFLKTAAVRVAGSHVLTGPDSIGAPPATFLNAPGSTYPAPFPAYPKTVRLTGNAFAGVKEPFVDVVSVFGVNSEVIFEDMWTGTAAAVALDANGVPTGAGQREQQLGAGSLRSKLTTLINEGTVRVINVGEHNPKTVAGVPIVVTADNLFLRRTLWDDTADAVIDGGTSLNDAQTALNNAIGYRSALNSLDTIAPPVDPSSQLYSQGAADTSAQRTTFALTASGVVPVLGFTGDAGNFGYFTQSVAFVAIDTTIKLIVTCEAVQTDPGILRRYTIKCFRITADAETDPSMGFVDVDTDSAPIWAAFVQPDTGPMQIITTGTAISIAGSASNYEFEVSIPLNFKSMLVFATAKVNGSRTIGGGEFGNQIGFAFDAIDFVTGLPFK